MATTLRNLKIKTNTCKRVLKELQYYEKEVEREAAKTAHMKEKGADPYDLKRQLLQRNSDRNAFLRRFSSVGERDEAALEEEVEKKAGWLLKFFYIGTAGAVGYQFFPYMGDTLLQQSISLLHVKDPLFKRMGASRLTRFAVDDERRMKVVEMGGAKDLLNMLKGAKDDKTRKEALKAIVALSHSDLAADSLHQAGAIPVINSTPNSIEYAEVEVYKSSLMKRFEELNYTSYLETEIN